MNRQRRLLLVCLAVLALILSAIPSGVQRASAGFDAWEIELPANESGQHNYLFDTVAISDTDVWAVGRYQDAPSLPLIEHWTGSAWSIVTAPSVSGDSALHGVAAVDTDDVWAVGYESSTDIAEPLPSNSQPTDPGETFIAKYNGTSWSQQSSPSPGTGFNTLRGACFNSTTDGWAVGFYYDGQSGPYRTLILRWNGTSWTQVTSPNPGTNNFLYDVHCVGGSDVVAVGNKDTSTLIVRYNGTSWSEVNNVPSPGTLTNYLGGVSCFDTDDCRAVGYYISSGTNSSTLVLTWDGSTWAQETTPNPGGSNDDYLNAADYVSEDWTWVVGANEDPPFATLTLKYTSDNGWTAVNSPNQGSTHNRLYGVSVYAPSGCNEPVTWAVGYYYDSSASRDKTLAERYTIAAPCSP